MAVRRNKIRKLAEALLRSYRIESPPVPVERIAKGEGLAVRKQRNADSEISGFLYRSSTRSIVGVNLSHAPVRQRFTVAHELGHFLLHAGSSDEVHVDRGFDVKFRDDLSSQGTDPEEREANLFAAELLMPRRFLEENLAEAGELDLVDDEFVQDLAKNYGVSVQAMLFRLTNLNYVNL